MRLRHIILWNVEISPEFFVFVDSSAIIIMVINLRLFRQRKKEKAAGICPVQIDTFSNKKGFFRKKRNKVYIFPSMYRKS